MSAGSGALITVGLYDVYGSGSKEILSISAQSKRDQNSERMFENSSQSFNTSFNTKILAYVSLAPATHLGSQFTIR